MSHSSAKCTRAALFTALASLVAGPVTAQSVLEEIIVTAQKRAEAVSDIPIAITAITSDQMNALGIITKQDIANFTPSMSYRETVSGGGGNRIYLRGIGRETNATGTEPGVGIYNNGFYTSEAGVLSGSVDRIERIEILRGPQGTLYGRNTTGGAVNVVTKQPGDEFEHIARVRAGNYNLLSIELTSSGPITDNVGYLLHYTKSDQDSFYDNVSGPDPIGVNADYIEGQIEVDFSDNINWHMRYVTARYENEAFKPAKLDGYRNEPGAPSKLGEIALNPELFSLLAVGPGQSDPFKLSADVKGSAKLDDSDNYQSTLTIDLEAMRIRLLNGYQSSSWYAQTDFDGVVSPASYFELTGQDETATQHEVQLISNGKGAIDWVVGLFYFDSKLDQPYTIGDDNNPFLIDNISGAVNPKGTVYRQVGQLDSTSKAIYGQLEWRATDRLALSAGLRYSEDEKEGHESQAIFYDSFLDNCGESFLPEVIASGNPYSNPVGCSRFGALVSDLEDDHKESWDAVSWRLNASYELTEASMAYATVSNGYKPGGFRLGGMQDDPQTDANESVVENEELIAYEIGYKGTIFETLSLNTAVFYYDYTDIQVQLSILDPSSGIVNFKLANASRSKVYGFELESIWAATEKLTLLGNYSYLHSEFLDDFFVSDTKTNIVRNVKGNELNRTPNHKFTLAAYYVQPVGAGDIVFTANYSYVDEQYVTVFNDDIESIEIYQQVNARVSWQPTSEAYEVALFGRNLTDELSFANEYLVSGLADGARRSGRPINPRVYGVEVAVFF